MNCSREPSAMSGQAEPGDAAGWHARAVACFEAGRFEDAERACRRLLEIDPAHAKGQANLGAILQRRGADDEAERCYRAAIAAQPGFAQAWFNLAMLLLGRGRHAEALAPLEEAVRLEPQRARDSAPLFEQIAGSLLDVGAAGAAVQVFRRAIAADPSLHTAGSNLLFALNYVPGREPEEIFAEHLAWAERFGAAAPARHDNDPDPARRIRVGYLSPDFREHALAFFIEPVLARHDRARVEAVCYSDAGSGDAVTARLRQLTVAWRESAELDAAALSRRIRDDRIDLLIDLAGHSAGGKRMALFALKPAPVQAGWLGYLNTTGLPQMDYRISDSVACPEGWERHHTERLVRLPHSQWCFAADASAPAVGPLPAGRDGRITFASVHNLAKVSARVIALWSRLLREVPRSRLFMLAPGLEQARAVAAEQFRREGIDAGRLEFHDRVPIGEFLALHDRIDINLDAFPYSGGTTTCHSLWMGVPVVTLAGRTMVSRGGASLLGAVGLPELVAESEDRYVDIARALADDLPGLARLRGELRDRVARSPLADAAQFTRDLESAYRSMWEGWCGARTRQRSRS